MTVTTLLSAGLQGIDAYPVHVEVDINRSNLPHWSTVGLAESAVREAKDRVRAALKNCGYTLPCSRITLNLAPANIKKVGTAFDLPIAVGLLAASDLLPPDPLKGLIFLGELSLEGKVRPIPGALSVALWAKNQGLKALVLPEANLAETHPIEGITIYGAPDLPAVIQFLAGTRTLPCSLTTLTESTPSPSLLPDLSEVRGQDHAKRALEITAAGYHNLLMKGPPGTGKSLLASRLPSLLPPLSFQESLETTQIYSLLGQLQPHQGLIVQRPFRSPHHTVSDAGLIGGGSVPRPGEVSMAHNGVLFLDELPEFRRNALEALRLPLETHEVTLSRAMSSLTFPARFLLVAAMNPCPCGYQGSSQKNCTCSEMRIQRYQSKVSGPLLDRMDLHIEVPLLNFKEITELPRGESSANVRNRVQQAWELQKQRFIHHPSTWNSQMSPSDIEKFCPVQEDAKKILKMAMEKWGLSVRAYHRVLKVARTIADLEACETLKTSHVGEALSYRTKNMRDFC